MRKLNSIGAVLVVALLILGTIFMLAMGASFVSLKKSNQSIGMVNKDIRVVLNLVDAINHTRTARVWLVQAAALITAGEFEQANAAIATAEEKMRLSEQSAKTYAASVPPEEKALAEEYTKRYRQYVDEGITPLIVALKKNDAFRYLSTMRKSTTTLDRQFEIALDKSLAAREIASKKLADQTQADFQKGIYLIAGFAALLMVLMVGIWWSSRRFVLKPLRLAATHLSEISSNNLASPMQERSRYEPMEIAQMLNNLEQMQQNLSEAVMSIRSSAESVSVASEEIAAGNLDLSNRTETQASSLQGVASSLRSINDNVSKTVDATEQADLLSRKAVESAQAGGKKMHQAIENMRTIEQSSQRINSIISVIDGISFQTNILALNAAVEAARAGEHGRGFAVVAGEVRSLAQRSAQAAKEIGTIISSSGSAIESGVQIVTETGSIINEIIKRVEQVATLVEGIKTATVSQSSGIAGVDKTFQLMDEMTQRNSALVEQSAAAAESLSVQAQQLKDTVNQFVVDAEGVYNAQVDATAHQSYDQRFDDEGDDEQRDSDQSDRDEYAEDPKQYETA